MKNLIKELLAALALMLITGTSVAALLQVKFPLHIIYFH
jgi:hypothetical protein